MVRRKKLFILIPALFLIPILLGIVPLNMAHKLAQGGPFAHSQNCNNKLCSARPIVSYNHLNVQALNSIAPDQELVPATGTLFSEVPESFPSSTRFHSIPLRC